MKAKRLVFAFALLLTLIVPLLPASAADGSERYTEWYSDAAKTNVVGWREEYCDGTAYTWGVQTQYKTVWIGAPCY